MTTSAVPSYAGYRFPAEVISHAVWLYFRFPLSLRMVEELLAARGIIVSYETVRQWALKFGQVFANQTRRRLPAAGDKWHMDEVVITISGVKHWLWPAETAPMLLFQPLRGRNLEQLRPHSGTAISSISPSTAAWPGMQRPATSSAPAPRRRWRASSR